MGNLLSARYNADLVQGANLGRQTAVHAEYFAVDDGGESEEVENLTACFPHGRVSVLCLTLLVKTVDLGDLSRLVVPADQCYAVGELCFQTHEQGEGLQTEVSAVDKVTEEDEVLLPVADDCVARRSSI